MNDRRCREGGAGLGDATGGLSAMSVMTTNCKPISAPAAEPTIT